MEKVNYSKHSYIINVFWGDRWQIYHRLKELEIPCKCSTGSLLQAAVETPMAALQVWSVARQQLLPRRDIANWLEECFNINHQQVRE